MEDLMKIDLYELLDIDVKSEEKEIKKAFRKKALQCHPDKNLNNPKSAELFQQLSKALEILLDSTSRAAYDKILKARKATVIRHRELDNKRKKFKEDLEAREKFHVEQEINMNIRRQEEIEKLRKESAEILEEIRKQQVENVKEDKQDDNLPKLKIKWKKQKTGLEDCYTQQDLQNLFEKYGVVTCIVVSKKRGNAIIEFANLESAQLALELEKGYPHNPFTISYLSPRVKTNESKTTPQLSRINSTQLNHSYIDFENEILMKLKRAQERERLIQQIKEEEAL